MAHFAAHDDIGLSSNVKRDVSFVSRDLVIHTLGAFG
jgi:hypothetical protein